MGDDARKNKSTKVSKNLKLKNHTAFLSELRPVISKSTPPIFINFSCLNPSKEYKTTPEVFTANVIKKGGANSGSALRF
jgi:hypothetical protein